MLTKSVKIGILGMSLLGVAVSTPQALAQGFSWQAPYVGGGYGSASSACNAVMEYYQGIHENEEFRMGNPFYRDTSSYYLRNSGASADEWDDSAREVTCNIERKTKWGWSYGGTGAGERISLKGDTCPQGTTFGGDGKVGCTPNSTPNPNSNNGAPQCDGGSNPINLATGNKFQQETDWVAQSNPLMNIQRHYNSTEGVWTFGYLKSHIEVVEGSPRCAIDPLDLSGYGCADLIQYQATLYDADGKASDFTSPPASSLTSTNGNWDSKKGSRYRLVKAATFSDGSVTLNDVFLRNLGQITEVYSLDPDSAANAVYLLRYVKNTRGVAVSVNYDIDSVVVSDTSGQTLLFDFNSSGKVVHAVTPDNDEFSYAYNGEGMLTQVIYPNQSSRQYIYDSENPTLLVGINDENGIRFASWSYDEANRANLSVHAGGADQVSLVFNSDGSTTVTNPLGLVTQYYFQSLDSGIKVPTKIEGFASANCIAANSTYTYDSNGYKDLVTDWEGNVTDYDHDDRGLEIRRTEAKGTTDERTIETEWHANFRLPIKITEPDRITEFTYDDNGRLRSKSIKPVAVN